MSTEPEDDDRWISIDATASFEDGDEALEALVKLKEADFGEIFTSRDTELDSEEIEGISISFYHDEIANVLVLRTTSENQLNISLRLGNKSVKKAGDVLNEILPHISPITRNSLTVHQVFERPFHTLDLPIKDESEYDVVGIRIQHENYDYIIQEEEDDGINVNLIDMDEMELAEAVDDEFVNKELKAMEDLITEEL